MRPKVSSMLASALVALEGVGVLLLGAVQIMAILQGEVTELASAFALLVLIVLVGVALLAFSRGILAAKTWARSGALVAQILLGAIGLGAITGTLYPHPGVGVALVIPAVVTFALIVVSLRQSPAREHDSESRQEDAD